MNYHISNATIYDGNGGRGFTGDVLVKNGLIEAVTTVPLSPGKEYDYIDGTGYWLTPGFIDIHTHYDGEIEIAPELDESVRHGITTIFMGSCGISMVMGDPEELSDMFTRVEGIPSDYIKSMLYRVKNWDSPTTYFQHLEQLNLGPNVAVFLGHSTIRSYVMGLERSLTQNNRPTAKELEQMTQLLEEALDQGYLGLSVNMLEFDKMDGSVFRSRPTPSVFADWREYRHLFRTVRKRNRVLQTVPNTANPLTFFSFIWESGGWNQNGLKTSMLAMIDGKAARGIHRVFGHAARLANSFLGAKVKFQGLPEPFDVVTHGFDSPFFEEFETGTSYLHLQEVANRRELLADRDYRRRFRGQWQAKFMPRVFHRKLKDTSIVQCPDPSLNGRSFREIAETLGKEEIDHFLDLIAQYGNDLRWYTVVGNDREEELNWIVQHPDCHIGFSDAGAHLKNMAHYNFGLRLLKFVGDRSMKGQKTLTIGQAVKKITKDLANWFLLPNLGVIEPGKRADLLLINPAGLDNQLAEMVEAEMPELPSFKRLVRRNDNAVPLVMINGNIAWQNGKKATDLGRSQQFGQLIRVS
jgi:N-acyl-D-aspartate/D-glutamate deacylase